MRAAVIDFLKGNHFVSLKMFEYKILGKFDVLITRFAAFHPTLQQRDQRSSVNPDHKMTHIPLPLKNFHPAILQSNFSSSTTCNNIILIPFAPHPVKSILVPLTCILAKNIIIVAHLSKKDLHKNLRLLWI